jgi:hypothetical protein
MKYFTKDWYKRMTITGFLAFPESVEEWEEIISSFGEHNELGITYIDSLRDDLEEHKEDLLKYLPESFHPYIHDGTLNTTYPSPELRKMADKWVQQTEEDTINVMKEYNKYFELMKASIPQGAQEIHEMGMHDARVVDYTETDEKFELILNDGGVKFSFTNVRDLSVPKGLKGRWWLYDELSSTDYGFELRVLLDDLSELHVLAGNVVIEKSI